MLSESRGSNIENKSNIGAMRTDYNGNALNESYLASDPLKQFSIWFDEAAICVPEANAMTLATADASGRPSARIVLLKEYSPQGVVFYTNYDSVKGKNLAENPQAALLFFWRELHRQVRISGVVEKVTDEESDAYFNSRPLLSRIGAAASRQSSILSSRSELEDRFRELEDTLGENPARPENWGGYRLLPDEIEFWQGRPNRLHDRIRYRKSGNSWIIERLSP